MLIYIIYKNLIST